MKIRILVTGRQYHLADSLPRELVLPEACSVATAINALQEKYPPQNKLPESCLVAVSGVHLGTVGHHRDQPLHDGEELLILAPVAGG